MTSTHDSDDLAPPGIVVRHEGRFERIEARVGELEDGQFKLSTEISELKTTLGRAPNPATNEDGSGMARVLAEIAATQRQQANNLLTQASEAKARAEAHTNQVESLRRDIIFHKEAPIRIIKAIALVLPILAAVVGATIWLSQHMRFTP